MATAEAGLLYGFLFACALVWLSAIVAVARDGLDASRLLTRIRTLNALSLLQRVRASRADVTRAASSYRSMIPLGQRLALALLSLAQSLDAFRGFALRLRSLLG